MLPTGQDVVVEFEIAFVDRGPADLEIALSGGLSPSAFRRFTDALNADPRFRAGLKMLVDLSDLDTTDLSDDGVQSLSASTVERDWHYPPAAVAIVAPNAETLKTASGYRAHLGG